MKPEISICIPAYGMNGHGIKYLKRLLQTIDRQTFKNYEIVISDHSTDNDLKNLAEQFQNVVHVFYESNRGNSSSNVNNAIIHSTTENIKIMFQDDFFVNENALEIFNQYFKTNKWGASGCIHHNWKYKQYYWEHHPGWNENIKEGKNSIGSPSVCFFKKCDIMFDPNLIWFMDTDFYCRLYERYGTPTIIPDVLVGVSEDETRVTDTLINKEVINKETQIIKEKYDRK